MKKLVEKPKTIVTRLKAAVTRNYKSIRSYLGFDENDGAYEKVQFGLTIFLQLIFVGAFIWAFFEPLWEVMFVSAMGMICIWLPLFIARKSRVHVPIEFIFLLTIFIFAALFLGEVRSFYMKYWWWDMVLHAFSGLALGFIGFLILYSLYRNNRLPISAGLLVFFSFCFALALGTIWEIFEFAMDSFFGLNMQRTETGVADTMKDLIIDATGALIASVSGYFYLKKQKRGMGIFQYYLTAYFQKNFVKSENTSDEKTRA